MVDPRIAQISVLSALAVWGAFGLELEVRAAPALAGIGAALLGEALVSRWRGARFDPRFDPRSPLISGLSLALLLRTADPVWAAVAGFLVVASKSLLRWRGKHVFNPTNFALVVLLLATPEVWVSAGQWGSGPLLAAALAGGALWVLPRARGDVSLAFLGSYAALLFGRALWLGDPLAIPLHQLESGALLIFALFMISDPRTIPDARPARIVFAVGVALLGFVGRFIFYEPNALLFALAGAACAVPLLDRTLPGRRFHWPGLSKEDTHVPLAPLSRPGLPALRRGLHI